MPKTNIGLQCNFQTGLILLLPLQGFRPEGEIPRRHSRLRKVLTDDIYIHTVNIEKISISLKRGRKESVGNDDVSIVCARK